jgi:hypothetical protein
VGAEVVVDVVSVVIDGGKVVDTVVTSVGLGREFEL